MIDFGLLPPEVNSGRMYAGAGSAPMMAAATAWGQLAAQLGSAGGSFRAVIAELADGPWLGPASVSMAAAAERYVRWLQATASRAEQAADQARAAAATYEQAFSATVPPPVVAANRAALAALVATNFFGQNTAAIAATELDYAEMWARDAAAMHLYAAGSAAASTLTPFTAPPQTTNPVGSTAQPGALAQTAAPAAAQNASGISNVLHALSNPLASPANDPTISALNTFLTDLSGVENSFVNYPFIAEAIQLYLAPLMVATGKLAMLGGAPGATAALGQAAISAGLASSTSEGVPGFTLAGSSGPGAPGVASPGDVGVSAGLGRAAPLSGLSVPPSWGARTEEIRLAAASLPASGPSRPAALPAPGVAGPGGWLGGPVGSVVNTPQGGGSRTVRPRAGFKAIPQIEKKTTTENRWAPDVPAAADTLSESERNELDMLREEMADLAGECDAMARLMRAAMR